MILFCELANICLIIGYILTMSCQKSPIILQGKTCKITSTTFLSSIFILFFSVFFFSYSLLYRILLFTFPNKRYCNPFFSFVYFVYTFFLEISFCDNYLVYFLTIFVFLLEIFILWRPCLLRRTCFFWLMQNTLLQI